MSEQREQTNGSTGSEAPASATVKCLLGGYEFLFTVRDPSAHVLLTKRVPAIVKALGDLGASPAPSWADRKNGNGAAGDEAKDCPLHHVPMKRHEKGGTAWWSHKATDESGSLVWCRGGAK